MNPKLSSRRDVVSGMTAIGLIACPTLSCLASGSPRYNSHPFSLGVASGDPTSNSVVIWTRLAPDPLAGGGMPTSEVPVTWEIATDEGMKQIAARGVAAALPVNAHAVHVEVTGLEPDRWYWYRFRSGLEASTVGRTRTTPLPDATVTDFQFAFASCQNYQHGHYTAHRHLAAEDLALVVFLGDYIYEGPARKGHPRMHNGGEATTLEAYRNRYALYKLDPDLQAAHAAFPWMAVPDDHEVVNDFAGDVDREHGTSRTEFQKRRAAAYQAYYEHLPFRPASKPKGASMALYRRMSVGGLATFNLLDTRQYRSIQPCGEAGDYKNAEHCTASRDPRASILGSQQEQWLLEGLQSSTARWNLIAQQVPLMQRLKPRKAKLLLNMDKWDGYPASRQRLLEAMASRADLNPIVLTGDVHSNWAGDLLADFDTPRSKIVGAEFIGTSISSGGDGSDTTKNGESILAANAHIKFYNRQRGYVRCRLSAKACEVDFRVVERVTMPGAPIRTRASFVVEHGKPGTNSRA